MKILDEAKQIFLTDVDEETYRENLERISEWERDLLFGEAYQSWRDTDITQQINRTVREAYKDHALTLATNRNLTESERASLWAKQDACLFILSITDKDAKGALESITREITRAINATS